MLVLVLVLACAYVGEQGRCAAVFLDGLILPSVSAGDIACACFPRNFPPRRQGSRSRYAYAVGPGSTRQHPSASVSTRQHPSAPASTGQHPLAPVSTRQRPSASRCGCPCRPPHPFVLVLAPVRRRTRLSLLSAVGAAGARARQPMCVPPSVPPSVPPAAACMLHASLPCRSGGGGHRGRRRRCESSVASSVV